MTLKEVRIAKGISQSEAAKFLNVPLRSYKRYEIQPNYIGTIKYNFYLDKLKNIKTKSKVQKIIRKPNVVIAGIGYVGITNGLLFSKKANISFVDISQQKVDLLNEKKCLLPNIDIVEAIKKTNFKATTDIFAYKNADIVLIATPTNYDESIQSLDTFSVESAIKSIREINKNCLIVIKSTVPSGFTDRMLEKYNDIIFCPEFLREQSAYHDAFYPSRIIIGAPTINKKIERFQLIIEKSIKNSVSVLFMSPKEAEATKLFSNAYLSMRIAFFNELDSFAIKNEIDSKNIIKGLGNDPRIGNLYNNPSIMYDGVCLPKDTKELQHELAGIENNQLISSITESNENRLSFIASNIIEFAQKITSKDRNEITIGIYNLHTRREMNGYKTSSSLRLFNLLKKLNINVIVFDKNYENSIKNFTDFINKVDVIVSNEYHKELKPYKNKVFTRSLE